MRSTRHLTWWPTLIFNSECQEKYDLDEADLSIINEFNGNKIDNVYDLNKYLRKLGQEGLYESARCTKESKECWYTYNQESEQIDVYSSLRQIT